MDAQEIRGLHIGEKLFSDCLVWGKRFGFGVLQFNAVVATNIHARHLYERLGFVQLGTIPKGFRMIFLRIQALRKQTEKMRIRSVWSMVN